MDPIISDELKIWIWKCISTGSKTKKELYDILVDDYDIFPEFARMELNWGGDDSWVKLIDENDQYPLPHMYIQLKESLCGGYGVFATTSFCKDDIIEYCRALWFDNGSLAPGCILGDYIHGGDGPKSYLLLGYGDLYNHSDNNNATFNDWADKEYSIAKITALRDIQPGEEIFVSYGEDYWTSRNSTKAGGDVRCEDAPKS